MKIKTFTYLRKQANQYIKRVVRDFSPPPYDVLQKLLDSFNTDATPPDVLLFGDSVYQRVANEDIDRRKLVEMVPDALAPHYRVLPITRQSYHPRFYYQIIRAIEVMRNRPSVVILPVNIRSFSPQWDLRPSWQYSEEIEALESFVANPAGGAVRIKQRLKNETTLAEEEAYRSTPVAYALSPFRTIGEFLDIIDSQTLTEEDKAFRKKQIFIFHYMHPLDDSHRNFIALKEMLNLLQRLKIRALFYITPINMEAGIRIVGQEFKEQVQANIRLISDLIQPHTKNGMIRYADWSFEMSAENFFHDSFATEHLNQAGRLALTQWIASEISTF